MSDPIDARVCALLAYFAGVPVEKLGAQSKPENTPGWDSVANLGLLSALEDEFSVTFTTEDAMRLRSVGDLAAFIAAVGTSVREGGTGAA